MLHLGGWWYVLGVTVLTTTLRNGHNRNGHKLKRPQTGMATNRNDQRLKWPQIEKRPQMGMATNRSNHKLNRHKSFTILCRNLKRKLKASHIAYISCRKASKVKLHHYYKKYQVPYARHTTHISLLCHQHGICGDMTWADRVNMMGPKIIPLISTSNRQSKLESIFQWLCTQYTLIKYVYFGGYRGIQRQDLMEEQWYTLNLQGGF